MTQKTAIAKLALAGLAGLLLVGPTAAAPTKPKTLGFVVTTWFTSIHESKFLDECPEGFTKGYDEIWWRGLSKPERAKLTDNGLVSRLDRFFIAVRRGPNGADVCLNPTAVPDPGYTTIEGKLGTGMNLTGTESGDPTAKTCKHDKFESPDGKVKGIDNQMYRLLGCTYGFHTFGQYEVNANENRKSNGNGMTLIEVTGVDDAKNDNDVTVNFYRAVDQYTLDGTGKFVPFASYRIDAPEGKPRYASSVKGKIVDGVLTTEPGDVHVPFYGNYTYMNYLIKDLRMRLEMAPDGASAKGMVGGYTSVDQFLYYMTSIGPIHSTGQIDCPGIYYAAHRLADGYPDKDGQCTHLSSAFDIKAVGAYVVHPEAKTAGDDDGAFDKLLRFIKLKG